ncbi:unnamed protein product [marine sediment metagenome]|uniref:Uncharacterized protein n=1 Tax=marine sediment metagenome TaxID=412755 RepID=X1RQJ8_9ZZZZ
MVSKKDTVIIDKGKVPAAKLVGSYTFLRDMGKALKDDEAIKVNCLNAVEAKKIQNRWRAYFKKEACTRREIQPDGKIIVYLWLEK